MNLDEEPMALRIRTPSHLVAAVPHLLGYEVRESMVAMSGDSGFAARVDLPRSADESMEMTQALVGPVIEHCSRGVLLIAFSESPIRSAHGLAAVVGSMKDEPSRPPLMECLQVTGDAWTSLVSGQQGVVTPEIVSEVAASFTLLGRRQPVLSREALAEQYQGGEAISPAVLERAAHRTEELQSRPGAEARERGWVLTRVAQFLDDQARLSDVDAARLLTAVGALPTVRDALYPVVGGAASTHASLWTDLARRSPEVAKNIPLAWVSLAHYLNGNGAQARVALNEAAVDDQPRPGLAKVVEAALDSALPPAKLQELIVGSFAEPDATCGSRRGAFPPPRSDRQPPRRRPARPPHDPGGGVTP